MTLLRDVKVLLRPDTGLAAVAVVLLGLGAYLYLERDAARDEVADLESDISVASADVVALREEKVRRLAALALTEQELAQAQEQLSQAQGQSTTVLLPSRQEALDLGSQLTAYAAERQLGLSSFASSQGTVIIGEIRHPR